MTREEAKEILTHNWTRVDNPNYKEEELDEAFFMAIEALKAEPTDTDIISRADAITEFREWVKRANENGETPTWNDAVSLIGSLPSAEQVISKLNNPCNSLLTDESNGSKEHKSKLDLISRVDAIDALSRSSVYAWSIEQDQTAHNWALNIIKALPSADAMPTVIRSKTFMRKEDFDKWADDIKKQNKSIVCIPCDAEVVSADSVVRCKDCRWWQNDDMGTWCSGLSGVRSTNADDYCSWGERND